MIRNCTWAILRFFITASACLLVTCVNVNARSFIDIEYEQAQKDYGVSYYLNDIAGLAMAKFCIPVSTRHGDIENVVVVYDHKFQTVTKPITEEAPYNEYLISFDTKTQIPNIILSLIYRSGSNETEININFAAFGKGNWIITNDAPVAELACSPNIN